MSHVFLRIEGFFRITLFRIYRMYHVVTQGIDMPSCGNYGRSNIISWHMKLMQEIKAISWVGWKYCPATCFWDWSDLMLCFCIQELSKSIKLRMRHIGLRVMDLKLPQFSTIPTMSSRAIMISMTSYNIFSMSRIFCCYTEVVYLEIASWDVSSSFRDC